MMVILFSFRKMLFIEIFINKGPAAISVCQRVMEPAPDEAAMIKNTIITKCGRHNPLIKTFFVFARKLFLQRCWVYNFDLGGMR